MQTYSGACHCGKVRFRVRAELATASLCNCSMCTKKGIVHLIVEPSAFELLSGEGELTSYRFNTEVAEHKFCRHCGIHPFYTPRSDPDKVDVNVRCLDGIAPASLVVSPYTDPFTTTAPYTDLSTAPPPYTAPGSALPTQTLTTHNTHSGGLCRERGWRVVCVGERRDDSLCREINAAVEQCLPASLKEYQDRLFAFARELKAMDLAEATCAAASAAAYDETGDAGLDDEDEVEADGLAGLVDGTLSPL